MNDAKHYERMVTEHVANLDALFKKMEADLGSLDQRAQLPLEERLGFLERNLHHAQMALLHVQKMISLMNLHTVKTQQSAVDAVMLQELLRNPPKGSA